MIWCYEKEPFARYGILIPVKLDIATYPHALITGSSGSGKSQALLFLFGKLMQCNPDTTVYFCDFKYSNDFLFLEGYSHYYSGDKCYQGVMEYYDSFCQARITGNNQKRYLLIFDEYPAFLNYLSTKDKQDKTKKSNDILGVISEMLMLGRGILFGVWIITQRADASLFSNGARDNFMSIFSLGNISKEQKGMIFSGHDLPDEIFSVGEGLMLADGKEIVSVKYPLIEHVEDWKKHILDILMANWQ